MPSNYRNKRKREKERKRNIRASISKGVITDVTANNNQQNQSARASTSQINDPIQGFCTINIMPLYFLTDYCYILDISTPINSPAAKRTPASFDFTKVATPLGRIDIEDSSDESNSENEDSSDESIPENEEFPVVMPQESEQIKGFTFIFHSLCIL